MAVERSAKWRRSSSWRLARSRRTISLNVRESLLISSRPPSGTWTSRSPAATFSAASDSPCKGRLKDHDWYSDSRIPKANTARVASSWFMSEARERAEKSSRKRVMTT
jgi:hypothetical protein